MTLIRKATSSDSKAIAACLLIAMEDIVYKFIGEEDPVKARTFMLYLVSKEDNQYSWQNCWVAQDDLKVVAAISLYDGARLRELRQPVIEYLKNLNRDLHLEDETQAGEYYLDTLGVSLDRQGKGIGTALLRFVVDEFVTRRGQTLGLLVDELNPDAKRLYLKLGFKTVERKVFMGKNMEHLQIKVLK
jgi:ribosomal protein S18 acetylase RimI-like enzyme